MIVIISNRNVNEGANDHTLFGDGFNEKGPDELRLAEAKFDDGTETWKLELIPEPEGELTEENVPSRGLFKRIISAIQAGEMTKTWVFFVHGFNQSFLKNLNKCLEIKRTYGVDVVAFSWPSNPGPESPLKKRKEYQRAVRNARASVNALDRTLEKLGNYMQHDVPEDCTISLNFLVHSLGNFLLENLVRSTLFGGETRMFDNVILHQADVDNENHSLWVDRIDHGKRIYVTINEDDYVLRASELFNPPRLGDTAAHLDADPARTTYVDFTDGVGIGNKHRIFYEAKGNQFVRTFFQEVLTGRRARVLRTEGYEYNPITNAYELAEKAEEEGDDEGGN